MRWLGPMPRVRRDEQTLDVIMQGWLGSVSGKNSVIEILTRLKEKKKEIFALWHEADYEDSQVEILRPYLHCVLNAEKIKAGCTLLTCQSQVKKKQKKNVLKVVVQPINKDFYAPIFSHKWDKNIFFERGKLAFSVRPKSSRFADFLRQRRFRGFLRGRGPRCVWSWTCPPWRWARSCRGCRSRGPAASVATRYASSPARVNKKKFKKIPF